MCDSDPLGMCRSPNKRGVTVAVTATRQRLASPPATHHYYNRVNIPVADLSSRANRRDDLSESLTAQTSSNQAVEAVKRDDQQG